MEFWTWHGGKRHLKKPSKVRIKRNVGITKRKEGETRSESEAECTRSALAGDVTERKQIEQLKDSEARYRTLFNSTSDSILIHDLGEILEANQTAWTRLGYTREELLQMAPSDIEAPQYAAKVPERIDELRRTHFFLSETAYVHKDGTVIPIELSSRIIEFKGKSVILSIARDISDRKKLTEIREQFLSHVTHELRTPLGPLKVHLDYAVAGKLGPVPEKLKSSLHVMKRSVDRLHELTNELLDLRRIQAGRFQLSLESMNFREILDDSIKEIQAQTDQKKQRVHVGVTEGPLPIRGDQTRLRQVLTNLLNNASKYTPEEGAITIKVSYDGDTIKCRISDTGIGIGKEDLPKVFEPFSNIKKPSSIQTAGLGLSITKGIVEAHGGKIWVESEGEGKGATFIFTLPKLTRVLQT